MNKVNLPFQISFTSPGGKESTLEIRHESETFDLTYQGKDMSLLNNGDNSWSQVKGEADQETVNLIGAAIEQYFQQLEP